MSHLPLTSRLFPLNRSPMERYMRHHRSHCRPAVLTALCLAGREGVGFLLVPADARALFRSAWLPATLALPLNALGFATDGIHFGAGDYRFLRNAMLLCTALGAAALISIDPAGPSALWWIWIVTLGWNGVRAGFGVTRVWPGIGHAPLGKSRSG